MTFGIDYAWGRPGVAALQAAGATFVCRYLSHDTTGKNLSAAEARELSAAGIWIVVVWEGTASRALAGKAAGAADARDAEAQARACGMPAGRPIYFAVDFDANSSQQDEIHAYLDGAASVLGRGRVGLYAGYGPVKRAFDAGKIAFGWQTYAWSGGRWDSRAQLQQYSNDHRVGGVGCDYDRAMTTDYGQWRVGATPEEDDMKVDDAVPVGTTFGPKLAHDHYPASYLWTGAFVQSRDTLAGVTQMLAQQAAMQATIDRLVEAVTSGAANVDLDALKQEIKGAIETAVESVVVHLDVQDSDDGGQ
ncbi:glycoside hydrolase domain-containing protein [Actinomadura nitritigenes]|uniref:glycoside hydrolase domain-containing protein n=1 Tax=Actinomadura nitritigenes TaxID=134602 RepID=UPI003D910F93